MDPHECLCRIKSARQKKRLVKKDHDKQLIHLNRRRDELWKQKTALPPVPLEVPYQRGWKRFFVLRDDVMRSPKAEFYTDLLAKINTVQYDRDDSFKRKKRRRGRYGYELRRQMLRDFDPYDWSNNRMKLSEQERACFVRIENFNAKNGRGDSRYVFAEPWRFVLKIAPYMVTHQKMIDVDIEKELAGIDGHIQNHCLRPRLNVLLQGGAYKWWKAREEPAKQINKVKNIARYIENDDYLDLYT